MENAGYITLSRQLVLTREMAVIANNIANMNTPAFKAERMIFREFIDKPKSEDKLSFVQDIGMARNLSEGPVVSTGNPLDLAITGSGYFSVDTADGVRYTRLGRFQLDGDSRIVNDQGDPVLSDSGAPITIPPGAGALSIAADGTITAANGTSRDDATVTTIVGRIGLFEFADENALKRDAGGKYDAGDQQPETANDSKIMQGMLEQSNVQAILEMTRMIDVHRAYQSTQRLLSTQHEQALRAINKLIQSRQG